MLETIGYFFENWDSDFLSISVVINIVLLLSGYFYGKIFQKYIKQLKKIDCTFLGIFFIFAVFEIFIFFNLGTNGTTESGYILAWFLLLASPILCLILFVNVKPSLSNLFSLLLGIFITIVLCISSSKFTTNNTYFDTVTYLSQVLEGATGNQFAHMVYAKGDHLSALYPIRDYVGYYYYWSMILRASKNIFAIKTSLTPIYIWGATVLYGMSLGNIVANSLTVLYNKKRWFAWIFVILILAPYYTNYFNTTLAFYGNTIRTVAIGNSMLIAYLYIKSKNARLFIPLTITYYACLSMTSSAFFLDAFITAGLFFILCIQKENRFKNWLGFILSCMPVFRFAIIYLTPSSMSYFIQLCMFAVLMIVLIAFAYLVRKHLDIVCKIGLIILPIALIGLIGISFLKRNAAYGYDYYFMIHDDDMLCNITNYKNQNELIRNVILYILLLAQFINIKYHSQFKIFLIIIGVLFLNPLTEPAVANLLTAGAYPRSFDLITNPFTLCFLIQNFEHITGFKYVNYGLAYGGMLAIGIVSYPQSFQNLTVAYSKPIEAGVGFNWEYKVTDDSYNMYTFVSKYLADSEDKPVILSQDISIKGYVSDIILCFSSTNFRTSLEEENYGEYKDLVLMFYPSKRYGNDGSIEDEADFSKLYLVVSEEDPDYVIMSNTLSIYDERGWYEKTYAKLEHKGYFTKMYENDSWVVLKVNKDYVPDDTDLLIETSEEEITSLEDSEG